MARKLPEAMHKFKFKPGTTGNPGGRPSNPIPNALKKLTGQQLKRIIKVVVKGNLDEIRRIAKDPKSSGLEVAIASCFAKAIERGDYATVEKMLERIVGKMPDIIEVKSTNRNYNANINADVPLDKIKAALEKIQSQY